jgi:cell division protein FtsQ
MQSLAARIGVALRLPRITAGRVTIVVMLCGLVIGGWLWLRDSSFVAIRQVRIIGASGPDAHRIRSALDDAARSMTTLHVREDALRAAISPYPAVKDITVSTHFPHGLTIRVIEELPVALVAINGSHVPVAADGTLLRDTAAPAGLPTIPLALPPGGTRISDGPAWLALQVIAAAPDALRSKIGRVLRTRAHGLEVLLSSGPAIWFGDGTQLAAKWAAAASVLADPTSAGARYIDVWVPQRPSAGGLSAGATTSADSGSATTATTTAGATSSVPASPSESPAATATGAATTTGG